MSVPLDSRALQSLTFCDAYEITRNLPEVKKQIDEEVFMKLKTVYPNLGKECGEEERARLYTYLATIHQECAFQCVKIWDDADLLKKYAPIWGGDVVRFEKLRQKFKTMGIRAFALSPDTGQVWVEGIPPFTQEILSRLRKNVCSISGCNRDQSEYQMRLCLRCQDVGKQVLNCSNKHQWKHNKIHKKDQKKGEIFQFMQGPEVVRKAIAEYEQDKGPKAETKEEKDIYNVD